MVDLGFLHFKESIDLLDEWGTSVELEWASEEEVEFAKEGLVEEDGLAELLVHAMASLAALAYSLAAVN